MIKIGTFKTFYKILIFISITLMTLWQLIAFSNTFFKLISICNFQTGFTSPVYLWIIIFRTLDMIIVLTSPTTNHFFGSHCPLITTFTNLNFACSLNYQWLCERPSFSWIIRYVSMYQIYVFFSWNVWMFSF